MQPLIFCLSKPLTYDNLGDKLLTLFIAKRLLQHGEDDRVVQDKVTEVAGSCGTKSGVANQGVFIQQAAGGGGTAGRGEGTQHLHDTGEHQQVNKYVETGSKSQRG